MKYCLSLATEAYLIFSLFHCSLDTCVPRTSLLRLTIEQLSFSRLFVWILLSLYIFLQLISSIAISKSIPITPGRPSEFQSVCSTSALGFSHKHLHLSMVRAEYRPHPVNLLRVHCPAMWYFLYALSRNTHNGALSDCIRASVLLKAPFRVNVERGKDIP